jgi:hypothetical protein
MGFRIVSEQHLVNAWLWKPDPPPSVIEPWQIECYSGSSHYVVYGSTAEAAQARFFAEHPELRDVVQWRFSTPPQPKRRDAAPQPDKLLEADVIAYTALAKAFHPDVLTKKLSAHAIMQIINSLRDAAKAKP